MRTVDDYARIRYAFHTEHKKIREIAREQHCSRRTVRQAVEEAQPPGYRLSQARPVPALDPWKTRIDVFVKRIWDLSLTEFGTTWSYRI